MHGLGLSLWSAALRASAFDPLSLSPYALWDISRLDTLFQDAAGTIPVAADGDPVGRVLDLSGNHHHATQATPSKRPLYRTSGGCIGWNLTAQARAHSLRTHKANKYEKSVVALQRKSLKTNGVHCCSAAHNGLVAGSGPARPTRETCQGNQARHFRRPAPSC